MAASIDEVVGRGDGLPASVPDSDLLSVDGGIGVVSIHGPILRKPGVFARVFLGATDSEDISSALREAGARPDVKAVFLDIDSPGGTVLGVPELAGAVASLDARKPVYAFSSGLMCSAAYWIASQARAIYTTPSAQVGSIGVVQAVVDNSAALGKAGIKVEVFSVGKYKAMGAPGTALTDDQREWISSNLAEIAADFHAAVLAKGRAIPPEAMEGQTFSGKQARRFNLASVVADRPEAMRRLRVYQASVDTAPRAMDTAIEDQLAQAREDATAARRELDAQTELLNEASAQNDSLRNENQSLVARVAELTGQHDASLRQASALEERIAALEASQVDFDARLHAEVARVVASTGTTLPAQVTPAGDASTAVQSAPTLPELVTRYTELVNANQPDQAAEFYQTHLASHFNR